MEQILGQSQLRFAAGDAGVRGGGARWPAAGFSSRAALARLGLSRKGRAVWDAGSADTSPVAPVVFASRGAPKLVLCLCGHWVCASSNAPAVIPNSRASSSWPQLGCSDRRAGKRTFISDQIFNSNFAGSESYQPLSQVTLRLVLNLWEWFSYLLEELKCAVTPPNPRLPSFLRFEVIVGF